MEEFLLNEGISKAYGLYALSVIKGRALPDARDGMKPVQRRILFTMYESGYRHNKPYKKSARIVGEVLGKYHPHGDSPVYEAMVRLAQEFVMSLCLVQGQGNFGSIDGDNAASMRYTEARLEEVSEYLLQDYEKETVPMKLNYDGTLEIPAILPAQFPHLLVNGASGIAVGMATSIPPHNLGEVIDACLALIDDENLSTADILKHIKGPDFPTGGSFFGGKSLQDAYETGRGRVILRGEIKHETIKGKEALIITEIPYQLIKPRLMERISELIDEGPLEGISDLRDESSKKIRVVIELKKGANAEIIEQRLFALTPLQTSISFNMVALDNDQPKTLSLLELLNIFLVFREEVVVKRAEYLLKKTLEKAHILWGLALATTMLDLVIETIRKSKDSKEAESNLMQLPWAKSSYWPLIEKLGEGDHLEDPYYFTQAQAKGILELRLSKLTQLERNNLIDELEELGKFIKEQKRIITEREYRKELMREELRFIKEKFACPRRTKILNYIGDFDEESLIEKEEIVIMLTANGYIKRINSDTYRVQNRGGKGKIGHKKEDDPISNLFVTNTLADVLFFTSFGKVFSLKAYQIPEGSSNARGRAAVNFFKLEEKEKLTTILPLEENEKASLVFITTQGTIRRNKLSDFLNIRSNGKIAMKLEEGNGLYSVLLVEENNELLLSSSSGNSIRFEVGDIRIFESRSSQGIRAMKIDSSDRIIGAARIQPNEKTEILCITEKGIGKRSNIDEYRKIKRGGKGSKTMNINAKTGPIVEAITVTQGDDILLMTKNGQTIRTSVSDIRKTGRVTSGVILMKLPATDAITQAIRIAPEEIEIEDIEKTSGQIELPEE